jgi:hypothetical protein
MQNGEHGFIYHPKWRSNVSKTLLLREACSHAQYHSHSHENLSTLGCQARIYRSTKVCNFRLEVLCDEHISSLQIPVHYWYVGSVQETHSCNQHST